MLTTKGKKRTTDELMGNERRLTVPDITNNNGLRENNYRKPF